MRGRFANVLLPDGMRPAAVILSIAVSTAAGSARADRYGPMAEDLLWRPGQGLGDLAFMATWFFYALAVFVGGWAIVRFAAHLENPQLYGLAQPVVGMFAAVGLGAMPLAFGELLSFLPPPPVLQGD